MNAFQHIDWRESDDVMGVEGSDAGPLAFHIETGTCAYSESIHLTRAEKLAS